MNETFVEALQILAKRAHLNKEAMAALSSGADRGAARRLPLLIGQARDVTDDEAIILQKALVLANDTETRGRPKADTIRVEVRIPADLVAWLDLEGDSRQETIIRLIAEASQR